MKSILLVKKCLGLVEMMSGLVNASFILPEWLAVKMIFFASFRVIKFEKKKEFIGVSKEGYIVVHKYRNKILIIVVNRTSENPMKLSTAKNKSSQLLALLGCGLNLGPSDCPALF